MVLLDYDMFLSRLTLMFDKSRGKDQHVDITMKRYDGKTAPTPRPRAKSPPAKGKGAKGGKGGKPTTAAGASSAAASGSGGGAKARLESTGSEAGSMEYKCLIRATLKREGKQQKEKISLIVNARDVNKFQLAYCNLLKSHMDGLKKHKKVKAKKNLQ